MDVNTLAGAYRGGFSLAVTTENLPTLTSLLQKYREINFEQADTYLTDSVSPSFSVGYNFQTAQYELGITCNYVGPDYLTAGRDYIIDVYLAAFESIYPDLYDTVEFENGTYIDRIEEQMENTASVQQFVSFDQRVSRLIVDSEAFSDEFISAFLNFHIGVTNQAVFFSQGMLFTWKYPQKHVF